MTQERADEIVRKVIYSRLNVMPKMKDSVETFQVGRMIGQMQRQLEIELSLEIEKQAESYDRNQHSKGYKDEVNDVLDEIRVKIEKLKDAPPCFDDMFEYKYAVDEALVIIDNYKATSENKYD